MSEGQNREHTAEHAAKHAAEHAGEARGKHIRVVPLHPKHGGPPPIGAEEAARIAARNPHLAYKGGPLLPSVQVFTVYWGAAWQQPDLAELAGQLNNFFTFILTSPLLDQLAEYNVGAFTIGHGAFIGAHTAADSEPGPLADDSAVQNFLQGFLAAHPEIPQPGPSVLYFIYLPPGTVAQVQGDRSCEKLCGYHSDINGRVFYAVMPHPDCAGCRGSLSIIDALTSTSSHELCEAITDPVVPTGWYWFHDQNHQGEIGDICAWTTKQVGQYTVQREWSNNANACV